MSGIIGLFVGAVVLALAYQLGAAWMSSDPASPDQPAAPGTEPEPESA